MERRDFLKGACILCGIAVAGDLLVGCKKNTVAPSNVNFTIDLNSSSGSNLKNVGGYVVQNSVIVIHTSAGYSAFSAICTHQGCTVNFNASSSRIVCPCHNGIFDTNGSVVSGPPPSALKKYNTSLNGNLLTVTS